MRNCLQQRHAPRYNFGEKRPVFARLRRFAGLWAALCLLVSLCACGPSDPGADRTIRMELDDVPTIVDPLLASSDSELLVTYNIFEGLTRVSADGEVSLAAAQSVSQDETNTIYTFTLREANWSDGEPVRAQDFVFGMRRAVDPSTKAKAAASLFCIQNAEQIFSGELEASELGVEAVDEDTLVIRLVQPMDGFLSLLSTNMTFPCREDIFTEAAGRYGMTYKNIVCNGPFTLRRWTSKVSMTLSRNSNYNGAHRARSSAVMLQFDQSQQGRVERLNNQEVDFGLISDPSAISGSTLSLYYDFNQCYALWFNTQHPILKDQSARTALSGILDESLLSASLPGQYRSASGLIPESCTVGGLAYRKAVGNLTLLTVDAAQAKADYAAVSQSKAAKDASSITLLYVEGDAMKEIASRIAQQWQKELGAYISLTPVTEQGLRNAVSSGEYQIALMPFSSADNSALTMMYSFGNNGLTLPQAAAQELDSLLRQAESSQTDAERAAAIASAEQYLVDEAIAVPIVESAICYAARPVVEDVSFLFSSRVLDLATMGKTGD